MLKHEYLHTPYSLLSRSMVDISRQEEEVSVKPLQTTKMLSKSVDNIQHALPDGQSVHKRNRLDYGGVADDVNTKVTMLTGASVTVVLTCQRIITKYFFISCFFKLSSNVLPLIFLKKLNNFEQVCLCVSVCCLP